METESFDMEKSENHIRSQNIYKWQLNCSGLEEEGCVHEPVYLNLA